MSTSETAKRATPAAGATPPPVDEGTRQRVTAGAHHEPHSVLGAHPATVQGTKGAIVRAFHPDATAAVVLAGGKETAMVQEGPGFFAAFLPNATVPLAYRLRFHFGDGGTWERDDPYRFGPTLGEVDLHLFAEGNHRRLWEKFGANVIEHQGVKGVAFAVWAPNARRVSLVGQFNRWDGRAFPMRSMGASGVWELFVPDIGDNALYRYEIITREGVPRVKTDPYARKLESAPGTASIVVESRHEWGDAEWMAERPTRDVLREPLLIYEVHLGSWARGDDDRFLNYREIAPRLAEHVKSLGFTHIELLPVSEHPFYGSWGYQVSGYFAPTSRYGSPDDFRAFVDVLHQAGIGVILDWVPAHFPKDDYALRRFDGTALYEHEDPRLGEHPDWGTLIFNYGRNEVRNFLVANAVYWLLDFHVDGLRVDAVASMLYLDYSRQAGQWLRNRYGGRENLEAIEFLRAFNEAVRIEAPGCFTVAEESTAWPGVTRPVSEGGLGFLLKWNMGWMHDTLKYFEKDPIYRRFHHDDLTFAMVYEYSERFIMPLSHDEVVHLKGSLLSKMPGDWWQKFANLRALLAYQLTRPGKKLLFMGTELAQWEEWNHDASLPWYYADQPMHAGVLRFLSELGQYYRRTPALWRDDHTWEGFSWIDVGDRAQSIISYARFAGDQHTVVVLNLTPQPHGEYRIGLPANCNYRLVLSSDEAQFGGGGYRAHARIEAEAVPYHGFPQSGVLSLPPLAALVLEPESPIEPLRDTSGAHEPALDVFAREARLA